MVHNEDWGGITSVEVPLVLQTEWTDYRYFPIDEEWQRQACRLLNLQFAQPFERESGGVIVVLKITLLEPTWLMRVHGGQILKCPS